MLGVRLGWWRCVRWDRCERLPHRFALSTRANGIGLVVQPVCLCQLFRCLALAEMIEISKEAHQVGAFVVSGEVAPNSGVQVNLEAAKVHVLPCRVACYPFMPHAFTVRQPLWN